MAGGDPILSVAQMRAAEAAASPGSEALYALMERAGAGVADVVRRLSAGAEILVACGPGNNGGDGYVAARLLRERGARVRVAASGSPRSSLAQRAREGWGGEAEALDEAKPAPIFVDAVFGAGQAREIAWDLLDPLLDLAAAARWRVSVDVPSGIETDDGRPLVPRTLPIDLTLAIGALKPVHILPSARLNCGDVRLVDIGLDLASWPVRTIDRPEPPRPAHDTHKYSRGMIGVVAGEMPGAAILAAEAALRAGAGYVVIYGEAAGGPASLVRRPLTDEALSDERLDVVVVGPGLGRSDAARERVAWLLRRNQLKLVIDGDALHLFEPETLAHRNAPVILTPHFGEYREIKRRLGIEGDDDFDRFARFSAETRAMAPGGAPPVVVHKGATTYAVRDDAIRVSSRGNPWLSTAGTGDVLAGAIAAMAAAYGKVGGSMLDAAAAGVWLHAEAAHRLGASFIADDLAREMSAVRASL